MAIIITGTGSYTPENTIKNEQFITSSFYDAQGKRLVNDPQVIVKKFGEITGIVERRYVSDNEKLSDIAAKAAERALKNAALDPEKLDLIILAHNFGDMANGSAQMDVMPCVATRVKHLLHIVNPNCVAFDIVFGCAGWLQAMILARQYILAENAERVLIIGGDTLSRALDPHDRDSMIYSDGAGAAVIEHKKTTVATGIIASCAQTYSHEEVYYLYYGISNKPEHVTGTCYLKMEGKKIYEFVIKQVPAAMKHCLDKAGVDITQLKKIFIHQANEKMNTAILKRFYQLYNIETPPENIMPMNIQKLGNNSVATIPTLLDEVLKNKYPEHKLENGDIILLASVGAGMNLNTIIYIV